MTRGELEALRWPGDEGLLPAVVQDASTGEVRMLGWMNRAALAATLASGCVTFWSRSRGKLWTKGETSGHTLELVSVAADCDGDALLVTARPDGPTCHAGISSCFGAPASPPLLALERRIAARLAEPGSGGAEASASYTARLASGGVVRVAQKVGEEAVETALAAATGDDDALVAEAADLLYHLAVLLALRKRSFGDVAAELERRTGQDPRAAVAAGVDRSTGRGDSRPRERRSARGMRPSSPQGATRDQAAAPDSSNPSE